MLCQSRTLTRCYVYDIKGVNLTVEHCEDHSNPLCKGIESETRCMCGWKKMCQEISNADNSK